MMPTHVHLSGIQSVCRCFVQCYVQNETSNLLLLTRTIIKDMIGTTVDMIGKQESWTSTFHSERASSGSSFFLMKLALSETLQFNIPVYQSYACQCLINSPPDLSITKELEVDGCLSHASVNQRLNAYFWQDANERKRPSIILSLKT